MELRTVETFLKVASLENFSKAAEQLGYSQSAVTIQIQKLEKELGVPLFERIGKRVYLTEKGRAFIPYAGDLIRASRAAAEFSAQPSAVGGKLRIGGVESVCTALLPALLPEFYRRCPAVEVVARSGTTAEMLELLERNDLDLVVTLDEKIHRPDLLRQLEQPEEIIFVTLAGNFCPAGAQMAMAELCRRPFILTETGAAYRYELEKLLAQRDLEIRPILEIGNTETIINLLKKGVGCSFLPRFTVEQELRSGVLQEIRTDLPSVYMYRQIFYHRGKWVTPQMRHFLSLLEQPL